MDYIDGPNLLDVIKKFGPLNIGRATSYTRQMAVALDFAFRNKIIHRDVKPGNILIDRKGVARLLDMGLARFLNDHSDQLTIKYDDKIVLGTADYVAPEQVANSHVVDIRADIYALGGTLYCLLAGHPPFPSGTVSQKLLWHRSKEPAPIQTIRPEIPDGLAAVVAKMMAKEPKARYQTPAQVVAALEEFLPATVPLPAAEEMPRLSPAAMEGMNFGAEIAPEPRLVEETKTEAALSSVTAVLAPPKVAIPTPPAMVSPFGPSVGPLWGASDDEAQRSTAPIPHPARRSSPPTAQAGIETPPAAPAPELAPSPSRRNLFAENAPETAKRPLPWPLIAAIGGILLGVIIALVVGKM